MATGDLPVQAAPPPEAVSTGAPGAETAPAAPPPPPGRPAAPPTPDRKQLWLETATVLAVWYLPMLYGAACDLIWPELIVRFPILRSESGLIVYSVAGSALILFLIHRGGEGPARFGLVRPVWFPEILLALLIFTVDYGLVHVCQNLLRDSFYDGSERYTSSYVMPPVRTVDYVFVVLASGCNGFAEELVVRGYLFTRFEQLLGSAGKSLLITSALFAS